MNKTRELETYFQKYPDVPREVIIKEDCLRHGLSFTEAALEICQNYQCKSYYLFQFDQAKLSDIGKKESVKAPEEIKIFGGPYNLRPTIIANHISVSSPYLVDSFEDGLLLCDNSEKEKPKQICKVKLRKPPKYYSTVFEEGTLCKELSPCVYWGNTAFITVLRNCQYWGDNEECKFCDINANVREQKFVGRPYTVHKKVDQVLKAVKEVFSDEQLNTSPGEFEYEWEKRPHYLQLTGGTIVSQVHGKDDTDFYLEYVEPIKEIIGGRFPLGVQTAAKDKNDLKRLRDAGVNVHLSNFEVWDKNLFKIICPGKENFIGREEWIKRTVNAVDVFGEANNGPGYVAGVEMAQPWGFKTVAEAVRSTTEGLKYLMSHGVNPRPITWCIEPGSALAGHPLIPLDYYIQMDRNWYELWKEYQLPPIWGYGPMGPGRAVISNSAYADMGS